MKSPKLFLFLVLGILLVFPGGNASAEPVKVAEYFDTQTGEHFELFQERDGSFFCSVQHANGILSRFDVRLEGNPNATRDGSHPNLRKMLETRREHASTQYPEKHKLHGGEASRNREQDRSGAYAACREAERNAGTSCPSCAAGERSGRGTSVGLLLLLTISGRGAT